MIKKTCRYESVKYSKGFALGAILVAIAVLFSAGAVQAGTVTWNGADDMNWTQSDPTSWSGVTYQSGDTAQFIGTGPGAIAVAGGGVTPFAMIITSGSYTFSGGSIGGAGSVTKSGSGTLTFSSANTFSGGLFIKGGTVTASTSTSALGGSGTGAVTLGDNNVSGAATLFANNLASLANPITLNDTTGLQVLTIKSDKSTDIVVPFSGTITGTGNLRLETVLRHSPTYASINSSGTLSYSAGAGAALVTTVGSSVTNIVLDNSNLGGGVALTIGTLTVNSSGTTLISIPATTRILSVATQINGTGDLTLRCNTVGLITLSGNVNHTGAVTNSGTSTGVTTISGIIGSSVSKIVQNSAVSPLYLFPSGTGLNVFSGGLFIKSGEVRLRGNQAASTHNIYLGDTGGVSSATLEVGYNGVASAITNPIMLGTTSGALVIQSSLSSSVAGGVTGANNLTVKQGGANTLTFKTGSLNFSGALTNVGTAGSVAINSVIGPNVTAVVQNSTASRLILAGTNTYTGTTTVRLGTLETQSNKCLNTASSVVIASGAKMKLNFAGTNTIQTLKLGIKDMPKGVYGSSNLSPEYFEVGSGALNVLTGPPNGTLISFI